ncbi:MAG: VWA domain-containing protein [Ardenticatenaceae bacterium]|nr:VWA domain-containing protein [Ardenticatenaceae bacterium]MCB9444595.1 VWA domain-containing protein [Ardenticatenaceae bacterium]
MSDEFDYYAILGVPQSASDSVIRDAFAKSLSQFPADVNKQENPAYERIMLAYSVLSDPVRRETYDSLLAETAVSPLQVTIQTSRDQLPISESPQLVYLLVNVNPPESEIQTSQPINLSLVIDRSTSMKGERLEYIKSALELLINKLSPEDIISVISFSDRADVVIPSQPVADKKSLIFKIRSIYTSGGTEIFQGLNAGMKELRQVNLTQYNNHLILLTDGHTYGDADQCLSLAQQAAKLGIGYSAFGLGSEWNDQFLDQLVSPSGGQSQYIENPAQILDYLQRRISGLGTIYAHDLRLSMEFPKFITPKFGFKLHPFAQPVTVDSDELKLGNIEGRHPLSFLLELNIEPQKMENRLTLSFNFTTSQPQQSFKHRHQITVLENVAPLPPPTEIVKAVRLLNMYRMNEKVLDEVDAGQLESATKRMKHLTTRLLEAGQTRLAQQAYLEGERLSNLGELSPEGRKKLKYGTRALLAQTIINLDLDEK